ncbi:MAG TPA: ABC transporter permease [Firmicutes bacterium]|jgi:ribose/xylose/arabinose/galactoside ABC-type transport system permease subunit|nr:ABC transporter permease [Bacillota bacterium]
MKIKKISKKQLIKSITGKLNVQHLALIGFMIAIIAIMQIIFPLFLTPYNIEILAMNFVFDAIVALGMTFVIITGGIDLSVTSVFAFAGIIAAKLMLNAGLPIIPSILLTLVLCIVIGVINGMLSDILKVHPMIITMGVMFTLKGINLAITDGSAISGFDETFTMLGQGKILGLNIPMFCFLILVIIFSILLNNHKFFRQIYFIGGSEKAARLSGVNIRFVKIVIYALCAFFAGIAGILGAAKYGAAHWGQGNMTDMKAITAVAIGGASLYGGTGTIGGTVLGITFLAIINNAFVMSGIDTFWYDIVNGGMLLIAVLFSIFVNEQNEKRLVKKRYEIILKKNNKISGGEFL